MTNLLIPRIWLIWPALAYGVSTCLFWETPFLAAVAPASCLLFLSGFISPWILLPLAVAASLALAYGARRREELIFFVLLFYGLNIGGLFLLIEGLKRA